MKETRGKWPQFTLRNMLIAITYLAMTFGLARFAFIARGGPGLGILYAGFFVGAVIGGTLKKGLTGALAGSIVGDLIAGVFMALPLAQ